MPKPVAFLPAPTSGHLSWPPTLGIPAEPTVFVNNIPVAFTGAVYATHVNYLGIPHPSPTAIGTSTVTVYNRPICRIGDFLTCGDMIVSASNNTFAGP
jgi:uncharacterized Zn-binding protein involved in type VI secretion